MGAVRLFSRAEAKKHLKEFGCVMLLDEQDPADSHYGQTYWKTSWGFHFFVPHIGPNKMCPEHRFYEILADLAARAPKKKPS